MTLLDLFDRLRGLVGRGSFRDRFRQAAESAVEEHAEASLDFTPASLDRLDDVVDREFDTDRFGAVDPVTEPDDPLTRELEATAFQLGSYFGEVLVRTHDAAEWVDRDDVGWGVVVDGPGGEVASNVFHVAADCLREPSKFAAAYADVRRHAGLGAPDEAVELTSVPVFPDGTDVDALRERAESVAADSEALDFSEASLAVLDDRDEPAPETDAATLDLAAYLGETLVRCRDGEWTRDEGRWVVDAGRTVAVTRVSRAALDGQTKLVAVLERLDASSIEELGEDIAGRAAGQAERLVEAWPDYELDFSPASLAALDDLVAAELEEFEGAEPSAELVAAAAPLGCYFGEVVVRNHEAAWIESDGPAVVLSTESGDGVGTNVLQAASAVLIGNDAFSDTYERLLSERSN